MVQARSTSSMLMKKGISAPVSENNLVRFLPPF
jgi:hypothetical protein